MRMLPLTLLALLCMMQFACTAAAPTTGNESLARKFLETWLVDGNISGAKSYLSPAFRLPVSQRKASAYPAPLRELPENDRALTFALSCGGSVLRCADLPSCFSPLPGASTTYVERQIPVTADLIEEFPALADLRGEKVTEISFKLRRCNVAASVLFDETAGTRRVRSIMYLAN